MLEDLLEPVEQIFKHKDIEHTIKPMNIVKTDKVLKMLPSIDFKDPVNSFMSVIKNDLDKIIKISVEASGIKPEIISNMYPHELVALIEAIVAVNKPSFFLAWKRIEGAIQANQLTGKEPSKP